MTEDRNNKITRKTIMKKTIVTGLAVLVTSATFAAAKVEMPLPENTKIIQVGGASSVKTIEDALEQVAKLRASDTTTPLAICVAPGDYAPKKSLVFTSKFSATNMAPIFVYAADFANKPRIHGGDLVTGWTKTTFNGQKNAWVADASHLKPSDDRVQLRLTFNGVRQTAARYPNFDPTEPYTSGYAFASTNVPAFYSDEIKMRPEEYRKWAHPEDGMMVFCPRHSFDWRGAGILGVSNDVIRLKWKRKEQKGSWRWDRWCVQNMAEEFDQPGEWYYDPRAKKIYILTPDGTDPNQAAIVLERPESVFYFGKKSGNVTLAGLEIAGGKDGVRLDDADDISIIACSIHDVGGFGLYGGTGIWIYGRRTRVEDSDIFRTGSEGIVVHSHADDKISTSRLGIVIKNNYFHHCGELYPDGSGIFNCGQGVTITHNLMHDMPRCAIAGYGRFCDISYNRIRHTNTKSSDTGALYDSGWTQGAGSTIRYNWITDSIGLRKKGQGIYAHRENACGIYFDECSGGTEVYGNLVAGCHWTAVMMHNARWVTISNNVFVSNGWVPVWHYTHQLEISSWEKKGFQTPGRRRIYMDGWNSVVQHDKRWRELPSMAQNPYTDEVFAADGSMVMGVKIVNNVISYPDQHQGVILYGFRVNTETNLFDNNLYWAGADKKTGEPNKLRSCTMVWQKEDTSWEAWLNQKKMDRHSLIADPLFRDVANGDYRLKPESPAFKLGFTELPYDKMGLEVTRFRPVLPVEAEGLREHPEWLTDNKGRYSNKKKAKGTVDEALDPIESPNVRIESPNVRR